jgi:hypothetical protein
VDGSIGGATRTIGIPEAKQAASAALRSGNVAAGRRIALKILAAAPGDAEALLLVAQAEILAGNTDIARAHLAQAMTLVPGHPFLLQEKQRLERQLDAASLDPYAQEYLAARAVHMDYPKNIQLETVGRCNASCSFCPHHELDRKYDEMSDALYESIIAEAATIPAEIPLNFFLNVINEPFMDRKIFERIALINERIPRATIGLYTNFNVLPRRFFEAILDVRNLTYLNVSFFAANAEEYEAAMGIDFARTVANLRRFLALNRDRRIVPGPVYLSRIATMDERDRRFVPECEALFGEFANGSDYAPMVKGRANWLGQVESAQTPVPVLSPCNQWLNISVFCDGTVPHCCMDAKGEHRFGNVKDSSLLAIYNSPKFRALRANVLARGAVHPCSTCSLR